MTGSIALVAHADLDLADAAAIARRIADGAALTVLEFGEVLPEALQPPAGVRDVQVRVHDALPILPEAAGSLLAEACAGRALEVVLMPSSTWWREVAARLAVRLGGGCIPDVAGIRRSEDAGLLLDRQVYGGLAMSTVAVQQQPAVVTVQIPERSPSASSISSDAVLAQAETSKSLLARKPLDRAADLGASRRIVAAGRGLQSREDLSLIASLADALGASVACTRPLAEDLGWLPKDRQVGLTGQTVAPDLYLAVGISGQVQHVVGMRDSRFVVAINIDPQAPIFDVADVGVVGDLYEVLPLLIDALARKPSIATA